MSRLLEIVRREPWFYLTAFLLGFFGKEVLALGKIAVRWALRGLEK